MRFTASVPIEATAFPALVGASRIVREGRGDLANMNRVPREKE
jgi:hypothetical protein